MLKVRDGRQLQTFTGLSQEKLARIESAFAQILETEELKHYEKLAAGQRQCKLGAGRKSKLATPMTKLPFIKNQERLQK